MLNFPVLTLHKQTFVTTTCREAAGDPGVSTRRLWSCSRERIWELRPSPGYQQSLCANTPRWDGQLTIRQFSAQVSGLQRARAPCKARSEERSGRAAPLQTFPSRGEGKERFCRTAWGERQQIQQPGQESTRLLFKKRKKKKKKQTIAQPPRPPTC